QAEELCGVRPVQRQVDQRVVDIALVAEKLGSQGGKLQGRARLFDNPNRLSQVTSGKLAVTRGAPQAKKSFPLLFRRPALLGYRQGPLEILPGFVWLIQAEECFTSVQVGVRFLQPVVALFGELEGAVERLQRCCQIAEVEREHDADVSQRADLAV